MLSKADVQQLFLSASLSKSTPEGYHPRLVFIICILTAMVPNPLATICLHRFSKTKLNKNTVCNITSSDGSQCGVWKTIKSGLQAISERPEEIFVWNEDYLDCSVNFYGNIDVYMDIRSTLESGSDLIFM